MFHFLTAQLEQKIRRETLKVAFDGLVERLGCDPVKRGEFGVEQHTMSAQDKDRTCYSFRRRM
jgi:hypothetical protein